MKKKLVIKDHYSLYSGRCGSRTEQKSSAIPHNQWGSTDPRSQDSMFIEEIFLFDCFIVCVCVCFPQTGKNVWEACMCSVIIGPLTEGSGLPVPPARNYKEEGTPSHHHVGEGEIGSSHPFLYISAKTV